MLSLIIWLAKHPLRVGGCILLLYIIGSVVLRLDVRFVVGIFLFLTGVRGIIVAFLYVVALCPNPVFNYRNRSYRVQLLLLFIFIMVILIGLFFVIVIRSNGLMVGVVNNSYKFQWAYDPVIFGGLADLMPLLGLLLFLCIVRVVVLCGQQKQCLGGHRFRGIKRLYS